MSTTNLIISNPWKDNSGLIGKETKCEEENDVSDRLVKVAREELREDSNTKKQCLQQFRDWVNQNKDIENCKTTDNFLLKFLRVKKFSIPMAEQTLLKYLNFRKRFKEFMYGLDFLKCPLIDRGYIFVSPFRDSNGRRIIIYNVKKVDTHEFSGREIALAHAITYETLLADEETQILGVNHVADLEGANASFLTLFSVTDYATIIRWGEQSLPMRHKEINLLNFPPAFKYVYDFVYSNVRSQKLKDRIRFHTSFSQLHKDVDKRYLPQEFGGSMPAKEMITLWKKEMAEKRDLLLSYDSMNLLSDRGIICRRNAAFHNNTDEGSLSGSFRKLEVD